MVKPLIKNYYRRNYKPPNIDEIKIETKIKNFSRGLKP